MHSACLLVHEQKCHHDSLRAQAGSKMYCSHGCSLPPSSGKIASLDYKILTNQPFVLRRLGSLFVGSRRDSTLTGAAGAVPIPCFGCSWGRFPGRWVRLLILWLHVAVSRCQETITVTRQLCWPAWLFRVARIRASVPRLLIRYNL